MMLEIPKCAERSCIHFSGIKQEGRDETTERVVCKAFPQGIPNPIAYGGDGHLTPIKGDSGVTYRKAPDA